MNKEISERIYLMKNRKVPNEYQKTDSGIIPSDWESTSLGKRLRVFRGASPRPKGDPKYYGGPIPRLMIKDVTRDGKYTYPCIDSLTEEGAKKSRLLPKGSVVLSCSGTKVGIPGILGIDACIHDGFLGFDEFKDINPEYLYYFFDLLNIKLQASATRGGVFNNLTTDIMKEMNIAVPKKNEQDKITEILATLDKVIELKEKLLQEKQRQKKGLMDRLLTGKVRVSGFNEKKIKIISLKNFISEYNVRNKDNKESRILSVTNKQGFILQEEQFERVVASNDLSNYKIVKKGQFAYNPSRVNVGSLDLLTRFESGLLSPMYVIFECNEGLLKEYLYQFLKSKLFLNYIPRLLQGSVRDSLSFDALQMVKLFIPSIEEQKQIANILRTADKEINLIKKELEALKEQKKGLMQLLLTGIVRVKCD